MHLAHLDVLTAPAPILRRLSRSRGDRHASDPLPHSGRSPQMLMTRWKAAGWVSHRTRLNGSHSRQQGPLLAPLLIVLMRERYEQLRNV